MEIKIEPRLEIPRWLPGVSVVVAIFVALLLGAIPLAYSGLNPITAYQRMFQAGFFESYSFSDTLVKATPLILAGLGVAIAFRMRLWNIGAEGQLFIGAWATAGVALFWLPPTTPKVIMLTVMTVAGFVAGALWGAIPGVLRAKLGVNEIITSLMLTYVAIQYNNYFVYGSWGASGVGLTASFPKTAWFPRLTDYGSTFPAFRGMTAHMGFVYAVVAAVILFVIFKYSKWGFELKVIGDNPDAARYAGMNISRTIILTMIISGGLAGLAGMSELAGSVHRLQENFSPGYGFTAIIVAWLARLNPLMIIVVGYLFGGLLVGGDAIQPAGIPLMIQGIILFCVISADTFTRYRIRVVRTTNTPVTSGV
ncbi:MAG: ABC transporter permease [Chloroflexota bacterium]